MEAGQANTSLKFLQESKNGIQCCFEMRILHQLKFQLFDIGGPFFVLVASLQFLIGYSPAAEIPLNSLGEQFYSKTLDIEWKLPANELPGTARAFQVVPARVLELANLL